MPVLPVSLIEPIRDRFSVLLPAHPDVDPAHPLGCHRRRISDRVVFDRVVAALAPGSGYERIASPGCSDRPSRRRLHEGAEVALLPTLHALGPAQYDRMIGSELAEVAVEGCIAKAPGGGGGEAAGRSPVDRGNQGLKRSVLVDATGVPRAVVAAGANRHDGPLLGPTLTGLGPFGPEPEGTTVYLDRGYDGGVSRALLAELGVTGGIARKGGPAPVQVGKRWGGERTHAWMNGVGKLRRCTEQAKRVVELYLFPAAAFVVTRCLIQRARTRYRWPGRPTTRRLR